MMPLVKTSLVMGIGLSILLASVPTRIACSSEAPNRDLSTEEIFQKVQSTYASLTSYSDEGKIIYTPPVMVTSSTFHIKMARPNLYRIDLLDQMDTSPIVSNLMPPPKITVAWSEGKGYFSEWRGKVQDQIDDGLKKNLQNLEKKNE